MNGWSFEPIWDSYAAVALLCAILLGLVALVRPWPSRAKPTSQHQRQNWAIIALRAAVILMLAVAMLRPVRISTESQPQSATLIVLVDQSQSMNVQDLDGGRSRWQQLRQALVESQAELNAVGQLLDVRVYGFDAALNAGIYQQGDWVLPDRPDGEQTDLANAIRESLQQETGKRIAGMILLSDGAQRVNQPRYDVQQSVRELKRLNAPLYAVPFGKPRDQTQARDVAIEKLNDQYSVFVNNELEIRGALRVQGFVNRPIPVQVEVETPGGGPGATLGPLSVTATADDQLVDFQFVYTPKIPGAYRLKVTAETQDGELVTTNNRMTAYLNVLEGGIRILYLEGNLLNPEQAILRRSLSASEDIELDFRPIDPRRRDSWPIDLSDLFEQQSYDIVLIGDVDAAALGTQNLQRIANIVTEQGGGLLMTGGLNTLAPGGYRGTPIDPLLPMELGRFDRQEFGPDQPIRQDLHLQGPVKIVPTPGRSHFITHLANGEQANREAWNRLNQVPLLGANRLKPLRRNAIPLAQTPDGEPLLVARQFAPGRVLVFAADSTHRWWYYGFEAAHKRFWRQAILWLANQDEIMRRDVWVQLNRRRFRPGETIRFRAGAKSENGDVLDEAVLTASLQHGRSSSEPIVLTRDGDNWAGELTSLTQPGEYTIQVTARQEATDIGSAVARFQLEQVNMELADPAASPQQLAMLAAITNEAGGRTVPAEQLNGLLEQIRERPPEMKIEVESKWRFGDRAQDIWPYFALLMLLLGAEWYCRKKWGIEG